MILLRRWQEEEKKPPRVGKKTSLASQSLMQAEARRRWYARQGL